MGQKRKDYVNWPILIIVPFLNQEFLSNFLAFSSDSWFWTKIGISGHSVLFSPFFIAPAEWWWPYWANEYIKLTWMSLLPLKLNHYQNTISRLNKNLVKPSYSHIKNYQNTFSSFFCQKLLWPLTVKINCSRDPKNYTNSRPSTSNFKRFLDH